VPAVSSGHGLVEQRANMHNSLKSGLKPPFDLILSDPAWERSIITGPTPK
jgi:hypothetical protein